MALSTVKLLYPSMVPLLVSSIDLLSMLAHHQMLCYCSLVVLQSKILERITKVRLRKTWMCLMAEISVLDPQSLRVGLRLCTSTPVTPRSHNLSSSSGVARTSPLLGHSIGTLRLYEQRWYILRNKLPREVHKLIGGSGGILPPEFYSLPGRLWGHIP